MCFDNQPGYNTPLPLNQGPSLFPTPSMPDPSNPLDYRPMPSWPVSQPFNLFEKYPGSWPPRRPAPGEPVYVLEEIRDGFEVVIRGGKVYSVTVCGEDGAAYVEVSWWEHGTPDNEGFETHPQEDCFYWFEDAQKDAERRIRKRQEKAEEADSE